MMAHETKAMAGKHAENSSATNDDETTQADDEIEEVELPAQDVGVVGKINTALEKFASTRPGQMILEQCDRVLKIVEDTAKWSLPVDENSDIKLERPLPWVFFLTLIIWLRFLRFWLNVSSAALGTPHFTRQSMVYSIQIKRRNLRAIRVRGLKSRGNREVDCVAMSSSGKKPSIMGKVRELFSSAVCRPGQQRDVPARRVFVRSSKAKDMPEEDSSERCTTKRPRDDECADLNLTVDQMLNKYANENSEDDSDYIPTAEEDLDVSSSSEESSSSEGEAEIESKEKSPDTIKNDSPEPNAVEVKENGATKHQPPAKSSVGFVNNHISDADSGTEQAKTPREPASNSAKEKSTEVVPNKPQESLNTPPPAQKHQLMVGQDEEAQKKSTPGHETAACLKPVTGATTAEVPRPTASEAKDIPSSPGKCYRTITTQTSVEYDWSIVLKTEISHIRQPVRLPKLDCSVQQLTPASSAEDIFYSPVAHSTPKGNGDSSAPDTPESAQPTQKKPTQPQQSKQHQQQYNHYNKNRNKNRR